MSVYPWYKRMVRGASMDPYDRKDFIDRRSTRAISELPETSYFREQESNSLPNYSVVSRALSKYYDPIYEESLSNLPDPLNEKPSDLYNSDNLARYSPSYVLGRWRETRRQNDDYWLNRYHELYPTYSSTRSYYPYYGSGNSYLYTKPYWLSDPLIDSRFSYMNSPLFIRHMYL